MSQGLGTLPALGGVPCRLLLWPGLPSSIRKQLSTSLPPPLPLCTGDSPSSLPGVLATPYSLFSLFLVETDWWRPEGRGCLIWP